MRCAQKIHSCLILFALLAVSCGVQDAHAEERIQFNRDIRPLLSDTCFTCHGPSGDDREAGLRFDLKEGAFSELESGNHAIVAGNLEQSELYQRLSTSDESLIMPPPDSQKQLTPEQVELFKKWIEQGAKWEEHWSFIPPQKPKLPATKQTNWTTNGIDHFVLKQLEDKGLTPSPAAKKETLLRRVTFDLTGLPPTVEEVDSFLNDNSKDAYEKVVDRLLKSPQYGEHMARAWLDAARYGDTHGLHLDNSRTIWPYRDWVIKAFNQNMPFDQFTIEQIGGDLLPNPTLSQKVATGFQRCNVTTSEGGSINEEYIVRYAVDRVETMGTVWLGLTLGCAVCHEHKYDPITQEEFYQLFAFYNSLTEKAMDGNAKLPPPVVKAPSAEQEKRLAELSQFIASVKKEKDNLYSTVAYTDPTPNAGPVSLKPTETILIDDEVPQDVTLAAKPEKNWVFVEGEEHPVYSGQKSIYRVGKNIAQQYYEKAKNPITIIAGDRIFAYVYLDPKNPPQEVMFQFHTPDKKWDHRAFWGANKIEYGETNTPGRLPKGELPPTGKWVRLEVSAAEVGLKPGMKLEGLAMSQFGGAMYWDKIGIQTFGDLKSQGFKSQRAWEQAEIALKTDSSLSPELQAIVSLPPEQRTPEQAKQARIYFLEFIYPETQSTFDIAKAKVMAAQKTKDDYYATIPSTLIMQDRAEPRDAFLLLRGEYDKHGPKVERGVPAVLPSLEKTGSVNRLDLAKWLVSPQQPLTARVTVNRYWQQYFGQGLVKTTEDFGSQGEWPSHPELLDWLAVTFMESGWDVKAFQKMIVLSSTYRQDSTINAALHQQDPQNRLLARGPRFRLDAEMIRDNALFLSGLLKQNIGGPSVRPYQPEGLWKVVAYTSSDTANFTQDHGEALYRRSMYTFWKRTSPPPSMAIFDAPSRETCVVKRERTNTPLQALNMMNDVQFVEASRKFAERMMKQGGDSTSARTAFGYRVATARKADTRVIEILSQLYESSLQEFENNPTNAEQLLKVGESPRDESLNTTELAAWTMVANTLLNLDETLTKE